MQCTIFVVVFVFFFCSCTIPHKEAAVKCCDEVDPVAKVYLLI